MTEHAGPGLSTRLETLYKIYSVPNPVDAPKWRLIRPFFDRENEYKAVSSARYVEKKQFCSLPGGVNTVGDTVKYSEEQFAGGVTADREGHRTAGAEEPIHVIRVILEERGGHVNLDGAGESAAVNPGRPVGAEKTFG